MTTQLNTQTPEKPTQDPDSIEVHHIWDTIQGEGPHAGRPAVFVRLTGCNIQCPACDTEYTSERRLLSPDGVVEVVRGIRPSGLVVLTGGEPMRQNISKLVETLLDARYEVQIETNGTIFRALPFDNMNLVIVCSPKTANVNAKFAIHVDAWKYVLDACHVDPKDGLPTTTMNHDGPVSRPLRGGGAEIYVQPLDEGHPGPNGRNLAAAVKSVRTYGYRLCLQTHKIIGLE